LVAIVKSMLSTSFSKEDFNGIYLRGHVYPFGGIIC
jgi:hypothetical protein